MSSQEHQHQHQIQQLSENQNPTNLLNPALSSDSNNEGNSINLININNNSINNNNNNNNNINNNQIQNALQQPEEQQFVLLRIFSVELLTILTKKNLLKGCFLLIILTLTIYMASTYLKSSLITHRSPSILFHSSTIKQIASPSQTAYISFDYYKKMIQLSRKLVKQKNKYVYGTQTNKQFSNIQFQELYSIFKVIKAIQLANGYQINTNTDNNDQGQQNNKQQQQQQYYNQIKYQSVKNLTAAVNLTKYFNPVPDQAECASCYSFPITATIQYQYNYRKNIKIKLSQQQIIDCSNKDPQANGCDRGNITRGFQYVKENGLIEEKHYPYHSQVGISFPCNRANILSQFNQTSQNHQNNITSNNQQNITSNITSNNSQINNNTSSINKIPKYKIKGIRQLPEGDCRAFQYQLIKGNAIATMINTGRMNYIKNYSQPFRDCLKIGPNHAVTIVGQTENQDWIVRNSWGQSWGNNGYLIIKKGNTCGICNKGMVPYLQDDNETVTHNQYN